MNTILNFVPVVRSSPRRPLLNRLGPFLAVVFLLAVAFSSGAQQTNYYCIVCGKGPLVGTIWLHPRGPICDDCEKIKDRCSICGLPVLPGDGHIQTGDGRLICKFDKADVIMTQDQAAELFQQTRDAVVDLYGPQFALKNPNVTVNLFDVDYWSEKGRDNGLHKYGFASSRPSANGTWTHEVVMLSGRTRTELASVAAHEYTHLWINENRPESHAIDGDTIEAICELTAYKLMEARRQTDMQKRILENPYTNGKIKDLVAVEREGGTDYVLNWVKNSHDAAFDVNANLPPVTIGAAAAAFVAQPRALPLGVKFSGVISTGGKQTAVINGLEFAAGDQKTLKLRNRSVLLRCVDIQEARVKAEADGKFFYLERGLEEALP